MGAQNSVMLGSTSGVENDGNVKTLRVDSLGKTMQGIIPPGTPLSASSGQVANGSAVATLAGAAGLTTYITGFQCTALGATGALGVDVTVAGLLGGTATYTFLFPAGVAALATPLIVTFPQPLPASAVNTSIVVTLGASGAGGTKANVNAQGFRV